MPSPFSTRAPRADDIPALAAIAEATLFPGALLADMIGPAIAGETGDIWRVVTRDADPLGFAFAQPEAMTDRSWNVRAIATSPEQHGQGAGTALLGALENALADAHLILIDTTQTEDQARARRFYAARGYAQVAVIPDFFAKGEDKVTFVKAT